MEDSGDDYDMDMDHRTRPLGGRSGRIILLGDGTEVLTDSADTEMFDHDEEDKDLGSQVDKSEGGVGESRSEREGTPGPTTAAEDSNAGSEPATNSVNSNHGEESTSTKTEGSETHAEPKTKAASDTPLSPQQKEELETS